MIDEDVDAVRLRQRKRIGGKRGLGVLLQRLDRRGRRAAFCGTQGKDPLKGLGDGLLFRPPAQTFRRRIHQLDTAGKIADHYGVGERDQDSPKPLFGVVSCLRVAAQRGERSLKGIADQVQPVTGEDAEEQTTDER